MTKVATIDKRRILSLVAAAAMVIVTVMAMIVPRVARAATSDGIAGTFTVNNGTFDVDNVTVYTTVGASTTNPSPNADYHVKVSVTDLNGLDKLTQVNVILFWESDGAYFAADQNTLSDNVQTHATFKWTPAGDFVLIGPSSIKWTCDNSSSIEPSSFAVTQDYFEFHVHIGDVATYAPSGSTPRWFAYASATDGAATPSNASGALTMQWYGAIDAAATVTWTGAAPGTGYTEQDVSVNYVANGTYNKSAEATSPWTGTANASLVNSDTPGANQFALKADDTNGSEPGSDHRLVNTGYTVIGAGTQTFEAGHDDVSGVWLKIGSPFTAGAYTGTITFQISN